MMDLHDTGALTMLHRAFDDAERLTVHQFKDNVCQMTNKYGEVECPLCVFRDAVFDSLRRQEDEKRAEAGK